MAFSYSNAVSGGGGFKSPTQVSAGVQVHDGEELQEIQTDQLGFLAINGDAQLRLLPTPWPADALPAPSSSLLSVASSRGFVAAAGPEALIFTSTQSIRDAFRTQEDFSEGKIRNFKPQRSIPHSRLSQVAFSSEESVIVVSTEDHGGLIAYRVDNIEAGNLEPALQLETNGVSLRALVPNPEPAYAHLFAAITTNGELLLANFETGALISGPNGTILQTGVSCLSWSNRGRQLAAGRVDGTASQIQQDGSVVAEIPKSTSIPPKAHVSGISWLENDSFFLIYTPNDTSDGIQPSDYYIVNREPKTQNYTFQRLPEVVPAFGLERIPTHHFITRLRNFPPHIQDMMILAATSSSDIAILSKTNVSLSRDDDVSGSFTLTTISEDARRAQLPLLTGSGETSPIGMALDLSSKENVVNPIPSDPEILESSGPVPNLLILNNEGILLSWWLVYNDSIRDKTQFSGLAAHTASNSAERKSSEPPQTISSKSVSPRPPTTASEKNSNTSGFMPAQPKSTFGTPSSMQSSFANSSADTFSTSSISKESKPSWTSTGFGSNTGSQQNNSTFGQSGFGSTAFGSASALGGSATSFGQPSNLATNSFGKAPNLGSNNSSVFGGGVRNESATSTFGDSSSSGFATYAKANGFGAFGDAKKDGTSSGSFADLNGPNTFSKGPSNGTFSNTKTNNFGARGFAKPTSSNNSAGTFEISRLGSSFKGDGSAKDDLPKPKEPSKFDFGSGIDELLGETRVQPLEKSASPAQDKEAEMGEDVEESDDEIVDADKTDFEGSSPEPFNNVPPTLVTPPATFTQSKATPNPPLSNLFGKIDQQNETTPQQSTPATWSFNYVPSTTPKETPSASHKGLFGQAPESSPVAKNEPDSTRAKSESGDETPRIKEEPPSDEETIDIRDIPEAPLPPETISKPRYVSGDTSVSSNLSKTPPDDAPLPPDFIPTNTSANTDGEEQNLPSDDGEFSSDFEGSGEDVTQEISPIEETTEEQLEQVQTSPESSMKSEGRSTEMSPAGGIFTKINTTSTTGQKTVRPLFGEVGAAPLFPPPKQQQSPRSPSPVRPVHPLDNLRSESSRSVSAPAHPRAAISQRKTEYAQSPIATGLGQSRESEKIKEQAQQEAILRRKAQAEAEQLEALQDDDDERIQRELETPLSPRQTLDAFITYQPQGPEDNGKSGIPAQIERLYQDINSMIYTLGINARSLSEFMQYQREQDPDEAWPGVLTSETPMDAYHDDWVLDDITRLHEGYDALSSGLEKARINNFMELNQSCMILHDQDLPNLRTKLTSIRKSLHARSSSENTTSAPLSPEQASIQHDLRKASASVVSKLVQLEDNVALLRAKIAEFEPVESTKMGQSRSGRTSAQKKPTVEAVASTVAKMTSSAEKKSTDIDILEAQFRKMNAFGISVNGTRQGPFETQDTPVKGQRSRLEMTPNSKSNSVYHTPNSKFSNSVRSTPGEKFGTRNSMMVISVEDKERWQTRAQQKKDIASALKKVLEQRRRDSNSKVR